MCNKKGFSLLSFMLYLLLFAMITFFSCHIIVSLIIPSFSGLRKKQSIIALHIATDLFVRDISAMQCDENPWKLISSHELVWQVGDHDIGWFFDKGRLERKEGEYNKGWKSKKTSIVAAGIAQATFTTDKTQDNKIIGIELAITPASDSKKPIICYVAVKKGEKA